MRRLVLFVRFFECVCDDFLSFSNVPNSTPGRRRASPVSHIGLGQAWGVPVQAGRWSLTPGSTLCSILIPLEMQHIYSTFQLIQFSPHAPLYHQTVSDKRPTTVKIASHAFGFAIYERSLTYQKVLINFSSVTDRRVRESGEVSSGS